MKAAPRCETCQSGNGQGGCATFDPCIQYDNWRPLALAQEAKVLTADGLYQLVNALQQSWATQDPILKPNGEFAASYNEHMAYGIHVALLSNPGLSSYVQAENKAKDA